MLKKAFSYKKSRFLKKKSPPLRGKNGFDLWVLGFKKSRLFSAGFFSILAEPKSGLFLS
ncbi:hypothetical protein BSMD_000330 [Bacillus subtilis Miyagi-4]|nr:hypothetical protein BSMD_000330 [Bacillus subtilis Miyagi-4]